MSVDTGSPIFNEPIIEWSDSQRMLMSWCKYYHAHYFSLDDSERPADKVFKYDPLFDAYVDRKVFKEKAKTRSTGLKTADGMQTVWSTGG